MKIADSHIHTELTDPQVVRAFLDEIKAAGATDASILALCAHPDYDIVQNLSALRSKSEYDGIRIRAFGSFHETDMYKQIPYEKQAESLLDLGCDGIKFIHMKPDCRKLFGKGIDHPDYDRALSLIEERGTPVVMHSGDPETFWDITKMTEKQIARGWYYGDGTYLPREAHYEEVFRMLDKHPRLNLSLAHFFFLSNFRDEARRVLEKYPHVRFDLTPGWEMYIGFSSDPEGWRQFFIDYGDRILFGTDSNDNKQNNGELYRLVMTALTHDFSEYEMPVWGHIVRGLDLPESVVEKIAYKNYIDFVGDTPRAVDESGVYSAAQRMLSDILDMPEEKTSADWLRGFLSAK